MSAQECCKCHKTVYVTEKVDIGSGKWIHKLCFKCDEPGCTISLNLKTFKIAGEGIFCEKHCPKPKATSASLENLSEKHALASPKKSNEGLHKIQVGTGETPHYGLEAVSNQHALSAPKKQAENLGYVQKGSPTKTEFQPQEIHA